MIRDDKTSGLAPTNKRAGKDLTASTQEQQQQSQQRHGQRRRRVEDDLSSLVGAHAEHRDSQALQAAELMKQVDAETVHRAIGYYCESEYPEYNQFFRSLYADAGAVNSEQLESEAAAIA